MSWSVTPDQPRDPHSGVVMDDILRIFDHTGDGAWAVDEEQRIVYWNATATRLLGFRAEEVVGRPCHEVLAAVDQDGRPYCSQSCPLTVRLRSEPPAEARDLQVRGRDSRIAWLNVSSIPVFRSGSDKPAVVVELFRLSKIEPAGAQPLRLYFLGRTEVKRADGTPIGEPYWRRAKVRALLAYLAAQRGRSAHRDDIVNALWPDLDRSAGLTNLNTTMYYLRRCLEPDLERGKESSYVQYEGDRYVLDSGAVHWVDVHVFERGLAQARREAEPVRAMAGYREALALYQGDFLADGGLDLAWCWAERDRLRDMYLDAMENLAHLSAAQRDTRSALKLLEQVLSRDPYRENTCQSLMQLSLSVGDRATAIAQYHRLSKALWEELEVRPTTTTTLLYQQAMRAE